MADTPLTPTAEYVRHLEALLVFADGVILAETGHALADLYAEDCQWAQATLEQADCHPRKQNDRSESE